MVGWNYPREGFVMINTNEANGGNSSPAGAEGIICNENG